MKNALRTRQWMFALALPLTAALYIGAEGLDPKGTDQIVTTTRSRSKCYRSQQSTIRSSISRARSPSWRSGPSPSRTAQSRWQWFFSRSESGEQQTKLHLLAIISSYPS
jgi:hypothetical protein